MGVLFGLAITLSLAASIVVLPAILATLKQIGAVGLKPHSS
ncbi:hypothetical protein [Bradyrhizobium icense]|nr:hypothetical protein [Bradyrhizobium icense]